MTTLTADPIKLWVLTLAEHAHVRVSPAAIDTATEPVTVPLRSVAEASRVAAMLDTVADDAMTTITQGRIAVWTTVLGREVCFRADVPGVGA